MQSVEEQARLNSDAMRSAASAVRAADALGPGKHALGRAGEDPSGNAPREGKSHVHSGGAGCSAAGVSSTTAEQRSRDSSQDRKTTREPEQDELLQPFRYFFTASHLWFCLALDKSSVIPPHRMGSMQGASLC